MTFSISGLALALTVVTGMHPLRAAPGWLCSHDHFCDNTCCGGGCTEAVDEVGGTWYWLRSPEEERHIVTALFNRYCIRCHGVDGKGVWDMPDVPDFTNKVWQSSRPDGQLARLIVEGRGAIMPAFRGTLSLEEAWAMARYLRTFAPTADAARPSSPRLPAPPKPTPEKKAVSPR
jgi:hypothetical protein